MKMTKSKFKLTLIPIILLLLSILLFGCATKMEATEIYKDFISYANKNDNIFSVSKNEETGVSSVEIKINYKPEIEKALTLEQSTFLTTGEPDSDFYLLKAVYEPTLKIATGFYLTNLNTLKNSSSNITKEEAGKIYDRIYTLKKSVSSFQNMLENINDYENDFKTGAYKKKSSFVYTLLDTFKVKYANVIDDCFNLNNDFIDLYYSIYNTTDYRVETSKPLDGLYVQMVCNQSLAKLAQVAFTVDGLKCNFLNTNKSSFEIENEESIINHTYTKHLSQITSDAQSLLRKPATSFQVFDNNENMKKDIAVLQTQLESFDKQYKYFENAIDKINYRDYVASKKSLEDYANTLSTERKSYLYIVEDFLNNNFANLCIILDKIAKQID